MRTRFICIILIMALLPLACKKAADKPYMNTAVITGYDTRTCACCGGLMINFENSANSYTASQFYIVDNPADVGVTEQSTFPVYLSVDWSKDQNTCTTNLHITITRFSK